MSTTYNNFTVPEIASPQDTLYGLFQCRGYLMGNDCARCVALAVSQLDTLCVYSFGGALQLEGCFVKYDNTSFLGVEDKTEVVKKRGPSIGYDSDALTRRDAVLASCGTGDGGAYKTYRTSNSGDVQGVAQCVGDLSPSETECGTSVWGDMYLAKCYVRYVTGGVRSHATGNGKHHHGWWFLIFGFIVFYWSNKLY
ncbi:isoform 2 of cysteine-rich repeat secretory protein 12 [Fagus crenata]